MEKKVSERVMIPFNLFCWHICNKQFIITIKKLGSFKYGMMDFISSRRTKSKLHQFVLAEEKPSVVSKLLSKLLEFDIFHVFKRETGTEFLTVSLIPLTILSFCSLPSFLLCHRQSNCNNTTTKIIPLGTIHQMISLFTS